MKKSPNAGFDRLPLLVDSKAKTPRRIHTGAIGANVFRARPAIMALLSLITLTYVCYAYASLSSPSQHRNSKDAEQEAPSLGVPRSVQQSWVMYSPYYPAEVYVPPPHGCRLDQVRPFLSFPIVHTRRPPKVTICMEPCYFVLRIYAAFAILGDVADILRYTFVGAHCKWILPA